MDLTAPDIGALVDRTRVIADDGLTTARIQVTANGQDYQFDGEREGRDYRLGEEEIHEIFRTATEGVLPRDQAAQLLMLLTDVENAKDVRDIMSASETVGAHVANRSLRGDRRPQHLFAPLAEAGRRRVVLAAAAILLGRALAARRHLTTADGRVTGARDRWHSAHPATAGPAPSDRPG